MIFASTQFLVFFTAFLLLLKITKQNHRVFLFIFGSLVFYGWWNPVGILAPLLLTLVAFWGGNWIVHTQNPHSRSQRLFLVILLAFAPLAGFKYSSFFYNELIAPWSDLEPAGFQTAIPLGLSFITFTIIAYIVDVYRRNYSPANSFSTVFAHVLFFPHLIAGPILRPTELIPQLSRGNKARIGSMGFGLLLFTAGLIKKVVFADSMGEVVDPVFDNPTGHPTPLYWMAILGYTMQIYFDFSGYTDMALGSARMMGVRLPENFCKPYTALSVREFWRRWHMTLSRWLRDYLYIPLGGNRCSKPRYLFNIMTTMTLCGLWHGANWTFILWGALHGLALMVTGLIGYSKSASGIMARIPRQIKWLLTFGFISLSWIFFRARDLPTAQVIFSGAFSKEIFQTGFAIQQYTFFLTVLVFGILTHKFDSMTHLRWAYRKTNKTVLAVFILMTWAFCLALSTQSSKEFIYFDF